MVKKLKTPRKTYREGSAYHEAAHAVIAHLLDWTIGEFIEISEFDKQDGYMGAFPTNFENHVEERIKVSLAGYAADQIFYGDQWKEKFKEYSFTDRLKARQLIGQDMERLAQLQQEVTEILQRKDVWKAVERMAAILLKESFLFGMDAHQICAEETGFKTHSQKLWENHRAKEQENNPDETDE